MQWIFTHFPRGLPTSSSFYLAISAQILKVLEPILQHLCWIFRNTPTFFPFWWISEELWPCQQGSLFFHTLYNMYTPPHQTPYTHHTHITNTPEIDWSFPISIKSPQHWTSARSCDISPAVSALSPLLINARSRVPGPSDRARAAAQRDRHNSCLARARAGEPGRFLFINVRRR